MSRSAIYPSMHSLVKPAKKIEKIQETIWVSINNILSNHKTINLGQGHVRLVNALAKLYSPLYRSNPSNSLEMDTNTSFTSEMELDPLSNIIISVGAYGSLSLIFNTFIDPGDECIIMEPAFDCYTPMVEINKGVPVYVQLKPNKCSDKQHSNDWVLDFEDLEKVVTKNTKMIVINTPHNPLGKVFNLKELEAIADFAKKHNLLVIADEVYEWISFKEPHIKIASLPGMWSRTLTVGSGGKMFSATGWKTGWTVGPKNLIYAMQMLQQNIINSSPTPLQVINF